MIKKHAKAEIEDLNEKNPLILEVNFDAEKPEVIRVTLGDKEAIIDRNKLWQFVYMIVTPDMAEQIVPTKQEEREVFSKQHYVKVTKDLKIGDEVVVNCRTDVRKEVADAMR